MSNLPEHTVRYHSSRREVWNWYWKAWRQRLWIFHVLIAALLTFTISGSNGIGNIAVCFLVTFSISTLLMAAGSQVLFKSAERVLRVTPAGWHTQIGKRVGSRPWTKVSSIKEDAGNIVITGTNQNALIVPPRAFSDSSFRQQFLADIQTWHRQAHAGSG